MKRTLLAATVALGAGFAGPALGQFSESQAVYDNYYYDANDELLLYSRDNCTFQGVERASTPAGTAYVISNFQAYCVNGQLVAG
jgi:hypothetical protein